MATRGFLETIEIATPCGADWSAMKGDDRARFCGLCRLNVYNLSGMTREEAEALVREKEGKLCVRMFQRQDGTVMTQDCPVGFPARARRKLAVALAGLSAVVSTLTLGAFGVAWSTEGGTKDPITPEPPHRVLMGAPPCRNLSPPVPVSADERP
jgi:hypothetical protein